jgi:hypothetical protein
MLYVYVHAAWQKPVSTLHVLSSCCISILVYMLLVLAAGPCCIFMLHAHAPCSCYMTLLYIYAASSCCMSCGMSLVHEYLHEQNEHVMRTFYTKMTMNRNTKTIKMKMNVKNENEHEHRQGHGYGHEHGHDTEQTCFTSLFSLRLTFFLFVSLLKSVILLRSQTNETDGYRPLYFA